MVAVAALFVLPTNRQPGRGCQSASPLTLVRGADRPTTLAVLRSSPLRYVRPPWLAPRRRNQPLAVTSLFELGQLTALARGVRWLGAGNTFRGHLVAEHRERIEQLTDYLERTNRRIADYETAAQSTDRPVSEHFAEKLSLARSERDKLSEHIQRLRIDDATHWNSFDPIGGGLLHGLLDACDELGGRIDTTLREMEKVK